MSIVRPRISETPGEYVFITSSGKRLTSSMIGQVHRKILGYNMTATRKKDSEKVSVSSYYFVLRRKYAP